MPKTPRITGEEAVSAFQRHGFELHHSTGSHRILRKAGHPNHLSIPVHAGKTIGPGLLKKLIRSAGLTVEQFIDEV